MINSDKDAVIRMKDLEKSQRTSVDINCFIKVITYIFSALCWFHFLSITKDLSAHYFFEDTSSEAFMK